MKPPSTPSSAFFSESLSTSRSTIVVMASLTRRDGTASLLLAACHRANGRYFDL